MDGENHSNLNKFIGSFIKELRINAYPKVTQKDVAGWIGNERTNYNRKENGKKPFSAAELLILLAKFQYHYQKSPHITLDITSFFNKTKKLIP